MIKRTTLLILLLAGLGPAQVVNCLVAVVNGEAITLLDLQVVAEFDLGTAVSVEGGQDPRRAALDALIDRKVVLDLAREAKGVSPEEVDAALAGLSVRMGEAGFSARLKKYGMTANQVLALKVALPDGTIDYLGRRSHESVGPDLVGMFVGSEGRFGIALEITLRLLPRPERYRTVLAAYDSLRAAGEAVGLIVESGLLPGAMEIMDRLAIDAAEAAVGAGYPAHASAILIVELEGPSESVDAETPVLDDLLRRSGATEIRAARDEAERLTIWKGRKGAFSAVGRLSPDYLVQDGVVPRSRLGETLEHIEHLGREYGLRVANVFHAGDGNLHPLILFDGRVAGQLQRAEELAGRILRWCIALGGSITGEHGVGVEKRQYLAEMYSPAAMATFERIRRAVDPECLANRSKMLADATTSPAPARDGPPEAREPSSAPA